MNETPYLVQFNSNLSHWKKIDFFILFLLIPFCWILIYLLPDIIKDSYFILHPQTLFIPQILLSNYTHSSWSHLVSNLIMYLLIMFLIVNFEPNRRYFYNFLIILFFIISCILSTISIILLPTLSTQGASGIIAGLLGYAAFASYRYLKIRLNVQFSNYFVGLIILCNALALWIYLPRTVNEIFFVIFTLIIVLGILINFYYSRAGFVQILAIIQQKTSKERPIGLSFYWIFLLSLLVLAYIGLIILVPINPIQNGVLLNTVVHYFGYVSGLLVPILYDYLTG